MKYCINCGNELRENATFCEKCGAKRGEKKQDEIEEGTIRVNVVEPNPPKDNTGKILLIVFGCVGIFFLIAIIGGFLFTFYSINTLNKYVDDNRYDLLYGALEELSIENFRLKYNQEEWTKIDGLNDKEKIIIKDDSTIVITKEELDNIILYEFENTMIENYLDDGYEEYKEKEEIYGYDDYWNKITFAKDNNIEELVYKIEDNCIYLLKYTGPKSYYNNNSFDITTIYYSLQIQEEE